MAIELLNLVGSLRFDQSIELIMFRRSIYDSRPSAVIHFHQLAENYIDRPIDVETSLQIAKYISSMKLAPSRIDIGRLNAEWLASGSNSGDLHDFIQHELKDCFERVGDEIDHRDVVLYGFGRIGRLLARRIIELTGRGEQLRLKAIVLRSKMSDQLEEIKKRAALLQSDSVHGEFHGSILIKDENTMAINGNDVAIIYANSPDEIDYRKYGIEDAVLIDNTGVWRDDVTLANHLQPGISKVILTAPGKNIPNIVHGVNEKSLNIDTDHILCAASCTTNAIVPIISVIDKEYGVEGGHIETIHAYTSDQNLLDNFHKKPRRGRGAAVNMVLTNTGAASAVSKVLPHLAGKLSGNAVRVPTPNVSLAIMTLHLGNETTVEEVNNKLKQAALHGNLVEQIHFSNSTEYVSTNAVGMTTTSVLDAPSTIVSHDKKTAIIYAWYDNEYGYACQVVRLAKYVGKVRRCVYY